jgi:hypothetical protein
MSSPGGPARVSGPVPGAAGVDGSPEGAPEPAGSSAEPVAAGETLRSVPDPSSGPVPTAGQADGAEPGGAVAPAVAPGQGAATPDGTDGTDGSWTGAGPDTGTVRRSRPSRSPRAATGVPTPPSPMNATTGPTPGTATGVLTGPTPVAAHEPPHRPVPPTFASPGQPPPGVARRHGRHAKPELGSADVHTPPAGYRPRHAAPDAETEQFAATPVTGPGGLGPVALAPGVADTTAAQDADATITADTAVASPADTATALHTGPGVVVPPLPGAADADAEHSDRVRVVLAERRVPTRAVRTVAEIEQQTETGELLLRNLLRSQLALAVRLGLVAVFVLGALPLLFLVLPRVGAVEVAGVTLPWLVLGLLPYPFMLALAWLYTRTAERNELDFADNVED